MGLKKLWLVVERDLRMFIQYKFLLIMRGIWFVSQVTLFGLVVNKMVEGAAGLTLPDPLHLPLLPSLFPWQR